MGKRDQPDFDRMPVVVRLVRRPETVSQKELVEALRAVGRRFMPKPERQHPEEALACPS